MASRMNGKLGIGWNERENKVRSATKETFKYSMEEKRNYDDYYYCNSY